MADWKVYRYTFTKPPYDGWQYVGLTEQDIFVRFGRHLFARKNKNMNKALLNEYPQYPIIEVLYKNLTKEKAEKLESDEIWKLNKPLNMKKPQYLINGCLRCIRCKKSKSLNSFDNNVKCKGSIKKNKTCKSCLQFERIQMRKKLLNNHDMFELQEKNKMSNYKNSLVEALKNYGGRITTVGDVENDPMKIALFVEVYDEYKNISGYMGGTTWMVVLDMFNFEDKLRLNQIKGLVD